MVDLTDSCFEEIKIRIEDGNMFQRTTVMGKNEY